MEKLAALILRPVTMADAAPLGETCWPDLDREIVAARVAQTYRFANRCWGIVACLSDEVVGFGQLMRWQHLGEISNLVVRADCRDQGIGTALIAALTDLAREQGMTAIEIGASEANPRAEALYRRLGFVEDRRVTFRLRGRDERIIYLVRDLP
jgi:ribosomal protein S18 acetylase RimI-like enzyme